MRLILDLSVRIQSIPFWCCECVCWQPNVFMNNNNSAERQLSYKIGYNVYVTEPHNEFN